MTCRVAKIAEDLIPRCSASGLLISKQRIDAKLIKKYDMAKTAYQRLMENSGVNEAVKAELCRRKNSLDLQQLLEATQYLQSKLISMARTWS